MSIAISFFFLQFLKKIIWFKSGLSIAFLPIVLKLLMSVQAARVGTEEHVLYRLLILFIAVVDRGGQALIVKSTVSQVHFIHFIY